MKKVLYFLIFLLITNLSFAQNKFLKNCFPQAESFLRTSRPFKHTSIYKGRRLLGVCFLASEVISNTRGFSGDIEVLVCVDSNAEIRGVKIVSHQETPGWGDKIESKDFLDQFREKSIYESFLIGKDIQGISSATISSQSVARIVRESSLRAYEEIFRNRNFIFENFYSADMDIILVSIFLILAVVFIFKRIVFLRIIFLSLVIVYFGFLKTLFISIFNVINLLKLQFPSFLESIPWYILFGFSFLGTLFLGRFYCGWLCPFGAVQDIISKIPSKKLKITYKLNSHLLKIKYLLLILALVFVLKGKDSLLKLEPFTCFFKPNFSIFFIYSLVILVFSLFIPRFFCRYFCFVGAIFAVLSKLSLLKYKLRCKKEGCNLYKERCPLGIIDELRNIKDSECIRCNLCQKCIADKKR